MLFNEKMYELGSKRSVIRELFEYGKEQAKTVGAENVYDFSIGNPTVEAPSIVNETIRELTMTKSSIELHGYTSAQGDEETRQAIADYLNKTYQTNFKSDNFYMTVGAAASLSICFNALTASENDEFIVIAPFFPEYKVFVEGAGAKLVVVSADEEHFQIKFDELEKKINKNTKGIIINSPNNPSGTVYTEETIKRLAELLKIKSDELGTDIFILSDEPYREIAYDGIEVPYVTKYYNNTIVCYSYSKSLSLPGERIGYILVPDEVVESKKVYAAICGAGRSLGFVCAPSMFQKVIAKCVGNTGDINIYKKNRDLLYQGLMELGYKCHKPQGAFYLFVKILGDDEEEFCRRAKDLNLLVVGATGFGCPGWVRVSYCVDEDMISRSFTAFKKLIESYK
ncbi:pyridoxal phosphate-dependent aminotransferase [Lachnobacterium bovis]|uniref:Aminotransferase n=1 Tax=Lachnobacterium bovis DSM 14045 TaxID=1122142 RepID=A0A1H3JGU2_9FIRM|nr:pyridoxal phosphate-dependent aminotransferase [Lachnobacterium bovis]SDY39141.1 aspartate aminotransferase [Lachnobacterium bovis DSM 14045]